jgi:hypothetical protein
VNACTDDDVMMLPPGGMCRIAALHSQNSA